jgi:hypothetical protein
LQVSASWPTLAYDDTQQAVRDFDRATGSPYAALYIRKVMGKGAQASRCIRVVQRSATQFRRYAYQAHGVDSADYNTAGWPAAFMRLRPGYYDASLCFTGATDVAYWHLLVKQGSEITFSLGLESGQYERLAAADQARLAPAFDLIQLLYP